MFGVKQFILVAIACVYFPASSFCDELHDYNPYNYDIPDYPGLKACSDINLSGAPNEAQITNVQIYYEIRHTCPWDLQIWFTAYYDGNWHDYPLYYQGDLPCDPDYVIEIRDNITYFNGASPNQEWYLCAKDWASEDVGFIDFFEIWVTYQVPDTEPPTVQVTSPNGGEDWNIGSTYNITWNSEDNVGVTQHAIEYSTNGGSNWIIVRNWTNGDPHSYSWTIPNTPSTACRVQVYCRDAEYNTAWDVSDANFTIRDFEPPTVQVTNPNGGEEWHVDSTYNITWYSDDNVGVTHHAISYSTNGGSNWEVIRDWTSGDPHTFPWTAPSTPSDSCRVQVCCRDAAFNIGCDISNGNFTIWDDTVSVDGDSEFPLEYALLQNYPNPYNPKTTIKFALPEAACVTISIYDLMGNFIEMLIREEKEPGIHQITWNAKDLPTGVYFYRIQAGDFIETRKMLLLK